MSEKELEAALDSFGLKLRGIATLNDHEIESYGFDGFRSIVLVGNIGSSFWQNFIQSNEYVDGGPDPLDRWSLRVANEIASAIGATPVFPFQGPPFLPFQRWAHRAEAMQQSPLGLMIHPQYGLWHAYRFALLISDELTRDVSQVESPCLNCIDQPCLNTCPVNAFSTNGYDVDSCAEYLKQNPAAECFQHGCMARFECPLGREYRYADAQSQFHLRAFIHARLDKVSLQQEN